MNLCGRSGKAQSRCSGSCLVNPASARRPFDFSHIPDGLNGAELEKCLREQGA
jgi:hypothetical protein